MRCTECQRENREDARFCDACGIRLDAAQRDRARSAVSAAAAPTAAPTPAPDAAPATTRTPLTCDRCSFVAASLGDLRMHGLEHNADEAVAVRVAEEKRVRRSRVAMAAVAIVVAAGAFFMINDDGPPGPAWNDPGVMGDPLVDIPVPDDQLPPEQQLPPDQQVPPEAEPPG